MIFTRLILILALSVSLAACGKNESSEGGGIRIIIDRSADASASTLGMKTLQNFAEELVGIASVPTTTSDFSCFAVNVTGAGVAPSGDLDGCTTPDNLGGSGMGVLSDTVSSGTPITLQIPTGPARKFDVFGIYPPDSHCGGGQVLAPGDVMRGYILGSKTVDIQDNSVITIPVSFTSGMTASISCTSSESFVQVSAAGHAACQPNGLPSSHTAPTATPPAPYTGDLTQIQTNDGTTIETAECSSTGGSEQTYEEYHFDLSSYNLAQFTSARLYWKGRVGRYSGSCGTSSSATFDGSTGALFVYRYNSGTSPSWEQLGNPTTSTTISAISGSFYANLSNYVFTGNKLIFRMFSPGTSASTCAAVVTDYVSLGLR